MEGITKVETGTMEETTTITNQGHVHLTMGEEEEVLNNLVDIREDLTVAATMEDSIMDQITMVGIIVEEITMEETKMEEIKMVEITMEDTKMEETTVVET